MSVVCVVICALWQLRVSETGASPAPPLCNPLFFAVVRSGLSFATVCALSCCENLRRSYPTNYILLLFFTLLESYLVAAVATYYESKSVLLAVGITVVVTVGLTIFAFQVGAGKRECRARGWSWLTSRVRFAQTRLDFTTSGSILSSALLCLICFGFIQLFWPCERCCCCCCC